MAYPTPPRPTNLLDYIPGKDVLSPEAWTDNAVLTFYKLLKNLKQSAKLYPLLDPKTSARFIADWALVEDYPAHSDMSTYPGGQSCQRGCAQECQRPDAHLHYQAAYSLLGKNRKGPERAGV